MLLLEFKAPTSML